MVKKQRKKIKKKSIPEIKIDQINLRGRELFLFDYINTKSTTDLVTKMIALDKINNKPIILWINSGGGSIVDGFSIIDTMRAIRSPVVTAINGMAASMAGIISVTGDKRFMTKNSYFMAHDGKSYVTDYFEKIYDQVDLLKKLQSQIATILRTYTKLSERDLTKARHGELWLDSNQSLEKKIIDKII